MWKSSGFFPLYWRWAKAYLFWGQNYIFLLASGTIGHIIHHFLSFWSRLNWQRQRWDESRLSRWSSFPKMSRGRASRRSHWPGRMRAGSRVSIRLVAMITFTSPRESKPSSWLSSSSMVLWISLSPPEFESYLHNVDRKQGFNLIRPPRPHTPTILHRAVCRIHHVR